MPELSKLHELTQLMGMDVRLYLRYSPGPEADAMHPSVDHESGLRMPGHSANPLQPPDWWTLPAEDWVARSICQYMDKVSTGARAWVLTGDVASFGPDNEPLLVNVVPVAWLSDELLNEAQQRYRDRMNAGESGR